MHIAMSAAVTNTGLGIKVPSVYFKTDVENTKIRLFSVSFDQITGLLTNFRMTTQERH